MSVWRWWWCRVNGWIGNGGRGESHEGREWNTREDEEIVQFFNSGNLYFHGVTLINYKI